VESDWLDRARRTRRFPQEIFEFRAVHQDREDEKSASALYEFRQMRIVQKSFDKSKTYDEFLLLSQV
jgi:hypothetical protein